MTWSTILSVFSLATFLSSVAIAEDNKPQDAQTSYDPRSAPGVGQKFLEKFVGDWDVEKIFHPRSGGSVITKGECHQTIINEGRFLKSEFVFFVAKPIRLALA
jgi:hypothetical protein